MNHDHPFITAFAVLFAAIKKSAFYIGAWIVSIGISELHAVLGVLSTAAVLVLTIVKIWKEIRPTREKKE